MIEVLYPNLYHGQELFILKQDIGLFPFLCSVERVKNNEKILKKG